jgi:transcriptional regulator with GAF, ATPase, and Fis domain
MVTTKVLSSAGPTRPAPSSSPISEWVLGEHPAVRRLAGHVERASAVECTVLVSGETGTGKEVWASLIHRLGPRAERPFVPVNCAALTATLAESQLFGH